MMHGTVGRASGSHSGESETELRKIAESSWLLQALLQRDETGRYPSAVRGNVTMES